MARMRFDRCHSDAHYVVHKEMFVAHLAGKGNQRKLQILLNENIKKRNTKTRKKNSKTKMLQANITPALRLW